MTTIARPMDVGRQPATVMAAATTGGMTITRNGIITMPVALPRSATNQLLMSVVGGTTTRQPAATPPSTPKMATNCHAFCARLASRNMSASAPSPTDATFRIDQRVIARPTAGADNPMIVTTSARPPDNSEREAAKSREMAATNGP